MTNQRHLSILEEIKKSGGDLDMGKPNDSVMLIGGMNLFIQYFQPYQLLMMTDSHWWNSWFKVIENINMIRPTRTIIVFDGKVGLTYVERYSQNIKWGERCRID